MTYLTAPLRCEGDFSHRVTAEFMNDDSVGEGFVVRFNMKSSFSVVQRVLLNEVDVIHACNLYTNTGLIILLQIISENLIKLTSYITRLGQKTVFRQCRQNNNIT